MGNNAQATMTRSSKEQKLSGKLMICGVPNGIYYELDKNKATE
jgi:hypothetical protein